MPLSANSVHSIIISLRQRKNQICDHSTTSFYCERKVWVTCGDGQECYYLLRFVFLTTTYMLSNIYLFT